MSVKVRTRRLPSGRTQIYLDTYSAGLRRTESLFTVGRDKHELHEKLKEARAIALKREMDMAAQRNGLKTYDQRDGDFLEYFRRQGEQKRKGGTRRSWVTTARLLEAYAGSKKLSFYAIDREWVKGFRAFLLARVSENSSSTYFAKLSTALRSAAEDGYIPENPIGKKLHITLRRKIPVFLELEEVQALENTPYEDTHIANAFLFSCFAGLRFSDVERLEWTQIDRGYVNFEQKKTEASERFPLAPQALAILERQRSAPPPKRRKVDPCRVFQLPLLSKINVRLKEWAKAAGVTKHISFHTSRHTFATLALSSGVDIYTVSKLMGHKSLSATQVYAKVIDKTKRSAVLMLPTLAPPAAPESNVHVLKHSAQ